MSDPPPPAAARPSWLGQGPVPGPAANADKIAAITAPGTVYPEFWPGSGAAIFSTELCTLSAKKLGSPPFPPVIVGRGSDMIKAVAEAAQVWYNKYKWQSSCILPSTIPAEWTIEDLWDEVDIHIEGRTFCKEMLQYLKGYAFYLAHNFSEGLRKQHPDRMSQIFSEMHSIGRHPQQDLAIVDKIFNATERAEFPRIFLWHVGNITYDYLVANNVKMDPPLANIKPLPTLEEHQETTIIAADTPKPETKATVAAKSKFKVPADIKTPQVAKTKATAPIETVSTSPAKTEAMVPKIEVPVSSDTGAALSPKVMTTTPAETETLAPEATEVNVPKEAETNALKDPEVVISPELKAADAAEGQPSLTNVAAEPARKSQSPDGVPATEAPTQPAASDQAPVQTIPEQNHQQPVYPGETMSNPVPMTQPSNVGHGANPQDLMVPNHNAPDMGFGASNRSRVPLVRGEKVNRVPSGSYSQQLLGPASGIQPPQFVGNNVPGSQPSMVPPNTHMPYGQGPMMMPQSMMPPPVMPNQHFEPPQMHGTAFPGQVMRIPNQPFMYHPQAPYYPQGAPTNEAGYYPNNGLPEYIDPRTGFPYHANFNNNRTFNLREEYHATRTPRQAPRSSQRNSGYNASNMLYDPYSDNQRNFGNPSTNIGGNKAAQGGRPGNSSTNRPRNTSYPYVRPLMEDNPEITGDPQSGCHHHWIGPENQTVKELFVGDLPEGVKDWELAGLFDEKTAIVPSRIEIKGPREPGNTRWHAFVGFSSPAETKRAFSIREENPTLRNGSIKVTVMVPKNCFSRHVNPLRRLSVTSGTKGSATNDERATSGMACTSSHGEEPTATNPHASKKKHRYSPQDARSDPQKKGAQKETSSAPALSGSPEAHKSGRRHGSPAKKKPAKTDAEIKMRADNEADVPLASETVNADANVASEEILSLPDAPETAKASHQVVKPQTESVLETSPVEEEASKAQIPSQDAEHDPSVEQHAKESETTKPKESDVAVTIAIIPPTEETASEDEAKNDNSFHSAQEALNDNADLRTLPENEVKQVPVTLIEDSTKQHTGSSSTEPIAQEQTQPQISDEEKAQLTESLPAALNETQPQISDEEKVQLTKSLPATLNETRTKTTDVPAQVLQPMASLATPGSRQTGSLSPFAKPSKTQQRKEKEAKKKQQKKAEAEKAKAASLSKPAEAAAAKDALQQSTKANKKPPPALPDLKLYPYKTSSHGKIDTGLTPSAMPSDNASIASSATLHADDTAGKSLSPPGDGYVTALQTPMVPSATLLDAPESKASHDDAPESKASHSRDNAPQEQAPKKKKKKSKSKKKANKLDDADIQVTQEAVDSAQASTVADAPNVNLTIGNALQPTDQVLGSINDEARAVFNHSSELTDVKAEEEPERAGSGTEWLEACLARELRMFMKENPSMFPPATQEEHS